LFLIDGSRQNGSLNLRLNAEHRGAFFRKAEAGPSHQLSFHPLLGLWDQQGFPGWLRVSASEQVHDPLCRVRADHCRRGPGQSDFRARAQVTNPPFSPLIKEKQPPLAPGFHRGDDFDDCLRKRAGSASFFLNGSWRRRRLKINKLKISIASYISNIIIKCI